MASPGTIDARRDPQRSRWASAFGLDRAGTIAVLVVLAGAALVSRPGDHGSGSGPVDLAAAGLGIALVVARRRFPLAALATSLVIAIVFTALTEGPTLILPVVVLLLFNVADRFDRRTAVAAGVATVVVVVTTMVAFAERDLFTGTVLASVAWPLLAVASGDAIRTHRAYVTAVEERARRAEETREEEARRRVAEERLRIARDLHDLVAHHIAVVNVQAGLAAHLLRTRPELAEDALGVVRSSAGTVLDELGQMLGVLRQAGETDAPVAPTPGADHLPSLIASFADAGLDVIWETSGSPRVLPDSTQLALYRMVQEGLTNAHKHGTGTARVILAHGPDSLEVTVENPVENPVGNPPQGDPGRRPVDPEVGNRAAGERAAGERAAGERADRGQWGGFGLVGMRERVQAVGGTLEAGPERGLFRVRARFPVGVA